MSESQEFFTLTAWSNSGSDKPNGFSVSKKADDRDRLFKRLKSQSSRMEVIIELPSGEALWFSRPETSLFWSTCPEFISSKIGKWIIEQGDAPWPEGERPKYIAELSTADDGAVKIKVLPKQQV